MTLLQPDEYPYLTHRSMAEVMAQERREALFKRWGQPAPREREARDLDARRKALDLTHERVAEIAGLHAAHVHKILSGKSRGGWFTLDLIRQAIERERNRREASKGSGGISHFKPLLQERAGSVDGQGNAAPRLAVGR